MELQVFTESIPVAATLQKLPIIVYSSHVTPERVGV